MTTHLLALLFGLVVGATTLARLLRSQRDGGCPS